MKRRDGFTLVEIVIIILIVGILAAIAVPLYVDMSQKALQSKEDYVVGMVREGIEMQLYEDAAAATR